MSSFELASYEPSNFEDYVGLLGQAPDLRQLFVVVASGLGFTLGPVLGRLMAELVAERSTSLPTGQLGLEHAV